jgi:hypothetical protein
MRVAGAGEPRSGSGAGVKHEAVMRHESGRGSSCSLHRSCSAVHPPGVVEVASVASAARRPAWRDEASAWGLGVTEEPGN